MRKVNLAVCALALAISSTATFAATNGTVSFEGKLINETCQIQTGDEDILVILPTLSTASLDGAGKEAGSTNFTISVVDCPAAVTGVAAHFEAINSDGVNPTTGNLTNSATTDAAGQAEVRLYNLGDSSQIRVGNTGAMFNVTPGADDAPGTATMSYAGGYYATAATTAGIVNAKVQYVLAYN